MTADHKAVPVMLVHGFLSSSDMVRPMSKRLTDRGFDVYSPRLSPFCIQDVRKLAQELSESVSRVLELTGAARCHIVGLSQGGIIALYYIKLLAGGDKTSQLVTVASPLSGTWAPVAGLLGVPFLGAISRGVWQVLPGSDLLKKLHDAPMPEGLNVTTIAVDGDLISPPARCHLDGARQITVKGVPIIAHQWMVLSVPVVDAIEDALKG